MPKQMIIPGEAGVGKSETIQMITENFNAHGVGSMLIKAVYMGLVASVIDGKMLHYVAILPLRSTKQSAQMLKALETYWWDKHYLIIISMVSCEMFAKLSSIISWVKAHNGAVSDKPFGGLNIILVGDFHLLLPNHWLHSSGPAIPKNILTKTWWDNNYTNNST